MVLVVNNKIVTLSILIKTIPLVHIFRKICVLNKTVYINMYTNPVEILIWGKKTLNFTIIIYIIYIFLFIIGIVL